MHNHKNTTQVVNKTTLTLIGLSVCCAVFYASTAKAQDDLVTYTESQAASGQVLYDARCATCHGYNLEGFELAPSLSGNFFTRRWGSGTADNLALNVRRMPPNEVSLSELEATNVLAYLLSRNGVEAGDGSGSRHSDACSPDRRTLGPAQRHQWATARRRSGDGDGQSGDHRMHASLVRDVSVRGADDPGQGGRRLPGFASVPRRGGGRRVLADDGGLGTTAGTHGSRAEFGALSPERARALH